MNFDFIRNFIREWQCCTFNSVFNQLTHLAFWYKNFYCVFTKTHTVKRLSIINNWHILSLFLKYEQIKPNRKMYLHRLHFLLISEKNLRQIIFNSVFNQLFHLAFWYKKFNCVFTKTHTVKDLPLSITGISYRGSSSVLCQ